MDLKFNFCLQGGQGVKLNLTELSKWQREEKNLGSEVLITLDFHGENKLDQIEVIWASVGDSRAGRKGNHDHIFSFIYPKYRSMQKNPRKCNMYEGWTFLS